MIEPGTLVLLCGKMAAGKSTLAAKLEQELSGVLISEDDWLAGFYPTEINTFDDYLNYSVRIKPTVKRHVQRLLALGVPVIMDFPANTRGQRAWLRSISAEQGYPHRLIYLQASDDLCLKRLAQRRQSHPERARFDTAEVFSQVTAYFEPPDASEGLNLESINA